ncbi:MAG: ComF family protein [Victivallaceae bacterium]|nr:ComF family protein [Victivallaceae bacterium]
MKNRILKSLSSGIELVCPFPCLACGVEPGDGKNLFCGKCLSKLSVISPPRCPGCGGTLDGVLEYCTKCLEFEKRPWNGAFALFNLRGAGQDLVYAFKFYGRPEMARPFASLAHELLKNEDLHFDVIIPVPLHWSRCFTRGYNQASLFCAELSRLMEVKCVSALRRVKRTRRQALLDREQRRKNPAGAFALKNGIDLCGKTILLVDDVMTTGATLTAAAGTFENAGIKALYTLVIGRR